MIVFLTDFGVAGPYVGEMKAMAWANLPHCPIVDLFHDLPPFDVEASAVLLAAYTPRLPLGCCVVCVVDPGVGTDRRPVAYRVDGRWYVGPDNGLFDRVLASAEQIEAFEISRRPEGISSSFHGRDLFTPVALAVLQGQQDLWLNPLRIGSIPAVKPLWQVVYLDRFGNAFIGVRADELEPVAVIEVAGRCLHFAETFGAVAPGAAFWYYNSCGLVEVAVNQGSARELLGLAIGDVVRPVS